MRAAVDLLAKVGAEVREINLPMTPSAIACYYLICTAEASSNLARYDGVHYGFRQKRSADLIDLYARSREDGFGPEVKLRILLGTYVLSAGYYDAYYLKATRVRTLIRGEFDEAFRDVDVVIGPTSPVTAFPIGDKIGDPLQMYLCDILTVAVNLAGLPAISLPCGLADGLPVGVQVIGKAFHESDILRVARHIEAGVSFPPGPPAAGDGS